MTGGRLCGLLDQLPVDMRAQAGHLLVSAQRQPIVASAEVIHVFGHPDCHLWLIIRHTCQSDSVESEDLAIYPGGHLVNVLLIRPVIGHVNQGLGNVALLRNGEDVVGEWEVSVEVGASSGQQAVAGDHGVCCGRGRQDVLETVQQHGGESRFPVLAMLVHGLPILEQLAYRLQILVELVVGQRGRGTTEVVSFTRELDNVGHDLSLKALCRGLNVASFSCSICPGSERGVVPGDGFEFSAAFSLACQTEIVQKSPVGRGQGSGVLKPAYGRTPLRCAHGFVRFVPRLFDGGNHCLSLV